MFCCQFLLHYLITSFFLAILNSLSGTDVVEFYQKYYQLLLHKQFPMKLQKLLLVGARDSGKSALFGAFEGKIVAHYILRQLQGIQQYFP